MNAEKQLFEIKTNKTKGASELMVNAIECLNAFSKACEDKNPHTYYESMIGMGRQLIDAQPSMASLFSAVNSVLLGIEKGMERGSTVPALKEAVKVTSEQLIKRSGNALITIQNQASEIITDKQTILTHSYSSTVISSLVFVYNRGKDIQVIVAESRPLFEGRRTARILSENGISVTLIADMASFHFLKDVDMILTGSDCICHKGVVNKIGTKGLAIAASQLDIPFYVLCERSKFLPSKYMDEPVIEEKEQREVLEEPDDFDVKNIYFDITPLRFITGIITEDGVVGVNEVRELLAGLEVCKGFTRV